MQFYILSPFILVPLSLSKKALSILGVIIALLMVTINIVAAALITDSDQPFQYPVYTIYGSFTTYYAAW
jgi:hypothetical protein